VLAQKHALTQITYPEGAHRYFTYNPQGRLSGTSRDGGAEAIAFSYDNAGKVTATDALGNASQFYFDHRGFLVKAADALGHAVSLTFGQSLYLSPRAPHASLTGSYHPTDQGHNLVRLTDAAGCSYRYTYDSKGNLLSSTDPLGYVTRSPTPAPTTAWPRSPIPRAMSPGMPMMPRAT